VRRCSSLARGKLQMLPTHQGATYRALTTPHAVLRYLQSRDLGQLSAIGEVDSLILLGPAHVGQTSRLPLRSIGDPAIASGGSASR
jgi:hypothetical protein